MKLFYTQHTQNTITLKSWVMSPKMYAEVTRPLQGLAHTTSEKVC